jgi:hypothetical protein
VTLHETQCSECIVKIESYCYYFVSILFSGSHQLFRYPFFKGSNERMQKYYAYGIRNSFGLAIDPISGLLWDTENGPDSYDEMNIVYPGFNSGWNQIMGPMSRSTSVEQAELEEELVILMVQSMLILSLAGKIQLDLQILNFSIQQHVDLDMHITFL